MKRQKRVAVINDVTGFGRCSAAVAQPIISAMKLRDADSNPVCTHGISKLFFTGLYTIS